MRGAGCAKFRRYCRIKVSRCGLWRVHLLFILNLSIVLKQRLLTLARDAIEYGAKRHDIIPVELAEWPASVRHQQASFVTLHKYRNLRGCIGSLEPVRNLVEDVAHNAHAAAFRDPRFFPG